MNPLSADYVPEPQDQGTRTLTVPDTMPLEGDEWVSDNEACYGGVWSWAS